MTKKMTAEDHDALKFGRRYPNPPRWATRPGPAPAPLREKVGIEELFDLDSAEFFSLSDPGDRSV